MTKYWVRFYDKTPVSPDWVRDWYEWATANIGHRIGSSNDGGNWQYTDRGKVWFTNKNDAVWFWIVWG